MRKPMQQITLRVMLQVVLGQASNGGLDDVADKVRRVVELSRGRCAAASRSRRTMGRK